MIDIFEDFNPTPESGDAMNEKLMRALYGRMDAPNERQMDALRKAVMEALREARQMDALREAGATHYHLSPVGTPKGYRRRPDGVWEFYRAVPGVWAAPSPPPAGFVARLIPLEAERTHPEVQDEVDVCPGANPDHWALLMGPKPHDRYEPWRQ